MEFLYLDTMKKRLDTEKSLSKNLEEKDQTEREFFKKREQVNMTSMSRKIFQTQPSEDIYFSLSQ